MEREKSHETREEARGRSPEVEYARAYALPCVYTSEHVHTPAEPPCTDACRQTALQSARVKERSPTRARVRSTYKSGSRTQANRRYEHRPVIQRKRNPHEYQVAHGHLLTLVAGAGAGSLGGRRGRKELARPGARLIWVTHTTFRLRHSLAP